MRDSIPQPPPSFISGTEWSCLTPATRHRILDQDAESRQLSRLTSYDDPGEAVRAVGLLAVTLIRGCAADHSLESTGAGDNFHRIATMVEDFILILAFRQEVSGRR